MAKTLFYGGHIITENDQDEIYQKGWVLVENDRIIGIGEGDPPEVDGEVERRNVQGHVVMPGFVNIHTHVGGTIFKAFPLLGQEETQLPQLVQSRVDTPMVYFRPSILGPFASTRIIPAGALAASFSSSR